MNFFILYISFSYCSAVNLRLLALDMLFLSAASRLQKQSSDKFPSSLPSVPRLQEGVGGAVAAPGVRPSPGLQSLKNTQENHNFLPLLTLLPLVCHGATLLTADPLHHSHCLLCDPLHRRRCAVCSHLRTSDPTVSQTLSFLSDLSSHCHHKVT